jgi:pyruvate dehydrogenase E2 component (dihydrolipoamide acetyltransferase)
VLASPAAKRIARENGIDLAAVRGSGPQGSVLAEDVLGAVQDKKNAAISAVPAAQIVPLSPTRHIFGERMSFSKQSAPHFYLTMDIEMTAVNDLRSAGKERAEGDVPSINDFILYACARALKHFPSMNSSLTDEGIKLHTDINLGMSVALEEGLVVPVIRKADQLNLAELAAQSCDLIDKARKKKLFALDYEGGTFTVLNLGMLGVDNFTAIIIPPQCAILAAGRVAPRVVVDNGMFAIKPLMSVTLSADHRVVDGAIGARFLNQVKQYLEGSEC